MKHHILTAGLTALVLLQTHPASAQQSEQRHLIVAAESREMIWNAVAVDHGRVFVAGPRWTGSKGPAVARIDADGTLKPYPDAAWNAWRTGTDAASGFVDVNVIHLDGRGGLWAAQA